MRPELLAIIALVVLFMIPSFSPTGQVESVVVDDTDEVRVFSPHPLSAQEQVSLWNYHCQRLRDQCLSCEGANVCRHYCFAYEGQCSNIVPMIGAFRN